MRSLVIGVLTLLCSSSAILAQTGTISGRVTDAKASGVSNANVRVVGTLLNATTDADGRFRIANVPPGSHTVAVLRIGYASERHPVTVSAGAESSVNFQLKQSAVTLEEVIVTGTAGGQELRTISNSVSRIRASDELEKSAAPNLSNLMRARATGLDVLPVTGRVGAGPLIQVRGPSSIGLSNSPLIYIDGVRVNNSTSVGPSGSGGLGGQGAQVANRLNDINAEDIETIEVIKGPAAATIYGTEATNGVVQIITKKGAAGTTPQVSLQVTNGIMYFRDAESRVPTNYMRDPANPTNIVAWNGLRQEADSGRPIFETGQQRHFNGSVSGSRDQLRYYVSAGYENDYGIEPNNSSRMFTSHVNVSTPVAASTTLSTSLNFVNLSNHLGADVGASALLGAVAGHRLLFPAARGFFPNLPPEVPQGLYDNATGVYRFTGSGTLANQLTRWYVHRAIVGLDYTSEDLRGIEHFAGPELTPFLSAAQAGGRIAQTLRRSAFITADYSGTAKMTLTPTLSSDLSVGGQFNNSEINASFLGGLGFPAPDVETVSAAATALASTQSVVVNTTIGAYVQEQLGWRDRLFLTAAVRVDNNSAFGEEFKWITYPKAGLSWVVSEEPFFRWTRQINTLRLRAAYGESGRQPAAFSALRTFSPVQGPGGTNAVTPNNLGNPDLQPERGKEFEFGFEASLFDRLGLEFTQYSKRTINEIVNQPVAPSSGFSGSRVINLGRVDSRGMEMRATYDTPIRPIFGQMLDWSIVANVSTAKNTIKENIASVVASAGAANIIGYPILGFWARRVVSADRDPTTQLPINILCEGPAGQPPVACATAPFLFVGPSTPKVFGSVSNTLNIGPNLRVFALTDFRRGHRMWNQNELIRCNGLAGAKLCEANAFPERYSPVQLANYVGTQSFAHHFQNASFVKLRELSTTYFLPQRFAPGLSRASITLAGRELHTWTKYAGIDPESSIPTVAIDQAVTPPLTRFVATLNLTW